VGKTSIAQSVARALVRKFEITNDLEFDFVEDLSEVFRITLRPT
jgi:hypothetical protein